MGSIQEPNAMPIAMASGSRDVEMRDADADVDADAGGQSTADATGIPLQVKLNAGSDKRDSPGPQSHVTNGHLTSDEKGSGSPSTPSRFDSSIPIPSVEKDEDDSPSTAAEHEEKTPPPVEAGRKENIQSSPAQPRHPSSQASKIQNSSETIKRDKEVARLNEVLSEISSRAAQKVLRDKWRFFLFEHYDESHISFMLRAGFKNANPTVVEKVIRDATIFKDQFLDVASKKSGVVEKVISNATVSNLSHVPQRVLDKALAERLKTVSARQLIKWLAEADRLGYKLDDILDEDDESVVPNVSSGQSHDADMADEVFEVEPPPQQPQQPHQRPALSYRDPLLAEQEMNLAAQRAAAAAAETARQQQRQQQHQYLPSRPPPPPSQSRPAAPTSDGGNLRCPACGVGFPNMSGYNYHITKKPCQKQAAASNSKWRCENCVQGFTTKQGMDYHKLKKVCLGEDIAPASSPSSQLRQEAQSRPQPPPQRYAPPTGPILPPPRPPFTSQPPPSQSLPPTYTSSPYTQSRPQIVLQRPPLHTPAPAPAPLPTPSVSTPGPKRQSIPDDVRHSPSELSPEKLAALERELQDAEDRYQQQIVDIPDDYTEEQRAARLISLKNANASRKSQIRKAHGVSLRLREKDKVARKAAGITPPGRPRIENRPAAPVQSMSTPTSTPPASSFSPVNIPPRSGPSPSDYGRPGITPYISSRYNGSSGNPPPQSNASQYNGSAGHPPPSSSVSQYNGPAGPPPNPSRPSNSSQYNGGAPDPQPLANPSSYKPPPLNARLRVQNPYSEPHPDTLLHALGHPVPSGFGVMRIKDLAPQASNTNTNNNKRRRSSEDHGPTPPRTSAGPPAPSSYFAPNLFDQNRPATRPPNQTYPMALSMMHVRAEDAANKLAKKTPLAEGQAQSGGDRDRDTPMTEAPPASAQPPAGSKPNTKETAITILSSSESESEPQPKTTPRLPPAILNGEKDKDKEVEKEKGSETGSGSAEEEEATGAEERREQERSEMRESRRPSADGTGNPRRGFMAKRGGKH